MLIIYKDGIKKGAEVKVSLFVLGYQKEDDNTVREANIFKGFLPQTTTYIAEENYFSVNTGDKFFEDVQNELGVYCEDFKIMVVLSFNGSEFYVTTNILNFGRNDKDADKTVCIKRNYNSVYEEIYTIDEIIERQKDGLDEVFPIDIIPNQMGINLCNVKNIEVKRRSDSQLVSTKINFIPDDSPEYLAALKFNRPELFE